MKTKFENFDFLRVHQFSIVNSPIQRDLRFATTGYSGSGFPSTAAMNSASKASPLA
jgi:hypothetical protein